MEIHSDIIKVLVIGSGGREHAIAHKLSESRHNLNIIVSPGNGGTPNSLSNKIQNINVGSKNEDIVNFALNNHIKLVVVGPEQPLVDGLCDALRVAGISSFGPSLKAARLEASKAWSKDFMERNSIPTARFKNFTSFESAKNYIESITYPVVIKASGLAAGKGVIIPNSKYEAIDAAKKILLERLFDDAGSEIVIEELLDGEEVSVLAFCDGKTCAIMPGAQDHKRIFDGDQGPNTGGMGAYAPAPVLTPQLKKTCTELIQKTLDALSSEGMPYEGVLYAGFMVTKEGPKVLEYNCRFGDPETQVLLPLLESDLYEVIMSCVEHRLQSTEVLWKQNTTACTVVCASGGYPGSYRTGEVITLPQGAGIDEGTMIYHAGTTLTADGRLVTSGGRVLTVTAVGQSIHVCRSKAYSVLSKINFQGMQYRKDIAMKALHSPLRIGVLGSTRGSSLQPIIEAIKNRSLNAKIAVCISNKKDAVILDRATWHNIPAVYLPAEKGQDREAYDTKVTAVLEEAQVDLVLMIGDNLLLLLSLYHYITISSLINCYTLLQDICVLYQ